MSLHGKWTNMLIDAEYDHFGTQRIVNAHNATIAACEDLRSDVSRLTQALEAARGDAESMCDSAQMLLDVLDELYGECSAVDEFQAPIRLVKQAIAARHAREQEKERG